MLTENWSERGHGQTLMWRIPNENKTGVYKEIPFKHLIASNISIFLTDFLLYPGADVESVTSRSQFKTAFPKLSAAGRWACPSEGPQSHAWSPSPAPLSVLPWEECVSLCSLCRRTPNWKTSEPASLSRTRPCQLWSCREDEWIPSSQHCWDPLCAPSVALERGHNLLLSALMVPSVDAGTAGLGFGPARWILPSPYCH